MKRARLRAMAGKKEERCSPHMLISRTVQCIERSVINADHKFAEEIPSCCMQQSVPLLQRHQVCARPVVVCKQGKVHAALKVLCSLIVGQCVSALVLLEAAAGVLIITR
jgi:hypothetical protein